MDKNKCPKSISLFTFEKIFVIENLPLNITNIFISIYEDKK
jgi:hypothetical protein